MTQTAGKMTRSQPKRVFTVEMGLYGLILGLALAVRLIALGRWPLLDGEAGMALASWRFARGLPASLRGFSPILFNWSALSSFLSGGSDGLIRLPSLLLGSALVLWPYGLRRYLGRVGALAAALILAFSPSLVYFSRVADGSVIVAFCGLGLVWSALGYWESRENCYAVASGVLLTLALLASPLAYTFTAVLLVLPGVLWLHRRLTGEEEPLAMWTETWAGFANDRGARRPVLLGVGLVLLIGGIALFLNPLGLQQALDLLGQWVGGLQWLRGSWYRLPLLLVVYETLPLVLGIVGLVLERKRRDSAAFLLRTWVVITLLVSIVPGYRPPNSVLLTLVPLVLWSAFVVQRFWKTLADTRGNSLLWTLVVVGCLVAFAMIIQLVTYLNTSASGYLLRMAALAVFLLSVYALVWSLRGAELPLRASVLLVLVLLSLGGIRTMARVNYASARDPLEPLVGSTVSAEVLDLDQYAASFSSQTLGDPRVMSWQVDRTLEVPLGWYLREFEKVSFERTIPAAPAAEGLIFPVGAGEPPKYVALRFAVHSHYPGGSFGFREWLRWWAGLDSAVSVVANEDAALWVRVPQR